MGAWRTISVALEANVAAYSADMAKAGQTTSKFGKDVDQAGRKVDDLDAKLGRTREGLSLGIAAGTVATLGLATKAASDLREAQAAANVVFGEGADAIDAWAAGAESALGLSKKAAYEAASTYGAMFNQLGVGAEQSAELSTALVKLGVDFASFRNADPTAVLEAQSAAFRGEYDALQKFIPAMSAAAVEQQALADTGKTNADQLTQQEKALATYRVMVANAGDAVGDFARSNGSAATEAKKANAQIENSAASIGEALLPAAANAAKTVGFVADQFGRLPGEVQTGTIAVVGSAAAWSRWGDTVTGVSGAALGKWRTLSEGLEGVAATRGITKTRAATEALKASLGSSPAEFGKFKSGALAAAAGMVSFGATLEILDRMTEFHGDVGNLSADLDQLGRGVADLDVVGGHFGGSVDNLAESFKRAYDGTSLLERGYGSLKSAVTGGIFTDDDFTGVQQAQSDIEALDQALARAVTSGNVDAARAAYGKLAGALIEQGVATEDVAAFLPTYWDAIDRADRETADAAESTGGMTRAAGRLEAQARRTASAFDELGSSGAGAFRGLGEGINLAELAAEAYTTQALGVYDAQQAYDASTVELTAHQREAADVQAQNAETARQNAEAIRRHAEDVRAAADDVAAAREVQAEAASNLAAVEVDAQAEVAAALAETLPTADAMVQAAERVTAAEEETARAAEAGRVAREGLNQALVDGARYLRDLAEAADDNNRSVARADLSYREALAAQAELAADPTNDDPFAAERAALRVADALDALQDAQLRAADSAQTRAEADLAGVDGTPQVLAAREAIARADEAEAQAAQSLTDARQQQAETLWNAALHLAEVQEESAARVAEAQGQLSDAADDVNTAQAALNATQAEAVELSRAEAVEQTDLGAVIVANAKAKLGLAEAEAFANGKTLTAAESAAILRQGLDEGRRSTGFWSGDLQTLSDKLDLAARQRTVTLETQEAMDRARELGYKVESLPNGHIRVTADTSQATGALDGLGSRIGALGSQLGIQLGSALGVVVNGYAGGGRVRMGEVAWVGEQGPELVQFPADGYVHDAATSRRIGMGTVSMVGGGYTAPTGPVGGTMAPAWAQPSGGAGSFDARAVARELAAALPHQGPLVAIDTVSEGVGLAAVFQQAEFASRTV